MSRNIKNVKEYLPKKPEPEVRQLIQIMVPAKMIEDLTPLKESNGYTWTDLGLAGLKMLIDQVKK